MTDDLKEDIFVYLDYLRESGETNMFGAVPFIRQSFPSLHPNEARDLLLEWMKTFDKRHPK